MRGWLFAALIALAGCRGSGPSTEDSKSNWLRACTQSSDCSDGLGCVCGVCTAPCAQASSCDRGQAEPATCGGPASCAERSAGESVCFVACERDDDCRDGQLCAEGACIGSAYEPLTRRGPETPRPEDGGARQPIMDGGSPTDGGAPLNRTPDGGNPTAVMPPWVIELPPVDTARPAQNDDCDYGRPPGDVVLVVDDPERMLTAFAVTADYVYFGTYCSNPSGCAAEYELNRMPRCGGEAEVFGAPWSDKITRIIATEEQLYVPAAPDDEQSYYELYRVDAATAERSLLYTSGSCGFKGSQVVAAGSRLLVADCKLMQLAPGDSQLQPLIEGPDQFGAVAIGSDVGYVQMSHGIYWVDLDSGERKLLSVMSGIEHMAADERALMLQGRGGSGNRWVARVLLDGSDVEELSPLEAGPQVWVAEGFAYANLAPDSPFEIHKLPTDGSGPPRRVLQRNLSYEFHEAPITSYGGRLYWLDENAVYSTVEQAPTVCREADAPRDSQTFQPAAQRTVTLAAAIAPDSDLIVLGIGRNDEIDLGGGPVALPLLTRFDRDAALLRWIQSVLDPGQRPQLAVGGNGTIAIAGSERASFLSPQGDPLFSREVATAGRIIALDVAGNIYLVEAGLDDETALIALDPAGVERWRVPYAPEQDASISGLDAADDGSVALSFGLSGLTPLPAPIDLGDGPRDAGHAGGTVVALYSSTGELRWSRLLRGVHGKALFGPASVVVVGESRVGVDVGAGLIPVPVQGGSHMVRVDIDLDGTVHEPRVTQLGAGQPGKVMPNGDVFVSAETCVVLPDSEEEAFREVVARIDAAGVVQWLGLPETSITSPMPITIDADAEGPVVAGSLSYEEPDPDPDFPSGPLYAGYLGIF